jgi:hypothetical protein
LQNESKPINGQHGISTVMSPKNVRVIQLALYYDFVLFNMQQKPFRVLLASGGGAIGNKERGTMMTIPNPGQPSSFVEFNPVKELHDALVQCLSDKTVAHNDVARNDVARNATIEAVALADIN